MSSKSSTPSNTTTTTELPTWAQPYAQQLLQRGSDLSNTTIPTYSGQMVAGMNDTQNAGVANASNNANNASNLSDAASQYYQSLTGGSGYQASNPYTGNVTAAQATSSYTDPSNNPYLAQSVNAANQQITDAYNNVTAPTTLAQFRNGGAFGGSAQDQYTGTQEKQLATALGNNTANMYNSAYNTAAGIDANLAAVNAGQANNVALNNQSVGTNAGLTTNAQNSSNYYQNINSILSALGGATQASSNAGTQAGNQLTAGGTSQQNSQDQLNALYQQWYNQVNQPYQQLSTLSSALSGALGSGVGTSMSSTSAGSGSALGTALGLGQLGLGAYNSFQ